VFIPTAENPVVPFRTAFSEYLLDKELAAGMAHRTRTGSRNSKVAEQHLLTKQQPGAKKSEGVASTNEQGTNEH
jgi:hypothetical protein